jgi:hypothetical protein
VDPTAANAARTAMLDAFEYFHTTWIFAHYGLSDIVISEPGLKNLTRVYQVIMSGMLPDHTID